jgi:hypothetical protein
MDDAEHGRSKDPVWDTNTQDLEGRHDEDSDDERLGGPNYGTTADDGQHPGRPVSWTGPFDDSHAAPPYDETEYRGASSYQPPSAMSPTSVYSPHNRAPTDYGSSRSRQGGGYSFSNPHADA